MWLIRSMGFRPLETFPTLWDEENPCLFLAKCLLHRGTSPARLAGLTL